jgi:hypothetical protein
VGTAGVSISNPTTSTCHSIFLYPPTSRRRFGLFRRLVGLLVVPVLAGGFLVGSAGAAGAVCPPGVSDGKRAPTPVMPGAGSAGGIVPEPADPSALADADPFAPGSRVTVLETYGGWAR